MNDLVGWKLRGPVRTLQQEHADWDPSQGTWQAPRGVSTVTFRHDGQVSEVEFHNPDGSVARSARMYDDGGRIIEAQSWTNDGPRTTQFYSYDAEGRLTAVEEVTPDGRQRQAESYKYDADGRKTKLSYLAARQAGISIHYGVEGTDQAYAAPGTATLSIAYDDRELPAEARFNDANGGLVRRIVFSRRREGHVLTELVQYPDESPFPASPNDSDTVPIEERAKLAALLRAAFPDQVFSSTTYEYDQNDRLLERTVRMGTLSEECTTFRYDDHDNPIAEISHCRSRGMDIDDDGIARTDAEEPRVDFHRFDYQYDDHGNWTERVVWAGVGSQPEFLRANIERRTIAYYEPYARTVSRG